MYLVTDHEVFSRDRRQHVVDARHAFMLLATTTLGYNHCQLAPLIGVDRSTISHAVTRVRGLASVYKPVSARIESVRKKLAHA